MSAPAERAGHDTASPSPPRPASTVVLLRDTAAGPEVFLVQRHRSLGFMGGAHVFPGGKVSETDARSVLGSRVLDAEQASQHAWGADVDAESAFARAIAAIRETYEEAGVLLCEQTLPADAPRARARLLAGEPFADVLDALSVQLSLALLRPLSRWITPESEPVRFDTSFYVARLPPGQVAEHDRGEAVDASWLSPSDALARSEAGAIRLAPPTARTLESLVHVPDVDAAFALAAARPPPQVMPVIRTVGDEVVIFYPGDPEHPVAARLLPGPTRLVLRRLS